MKMENSYSTGSFRDSMATCELSLDIPNITEQLTTNNFPHSFLSCSSSLPIIAKPKIEILS